MLGGEGHAGLLPFLASLESGRVGETALARRLAERDEGTEFRHTIVGKTFHQREFGSRADSTVTLPPRQQALLLEQGKQPARFQLAPRDCIEVQWLGKQALVVDDQVLGRRTFGGCGLDLVNDKAGQAALRLRTGKG